MLGDNKFGDMGAVAIGKALESNSSLNVLHLCTLLTYIANDNIGSSGVSAISRSLEKNRTVIKLYLGKK